uniref:Uncharacterized protein n=1 Tax=Anguilla anguilla TaxID=7936 RepID=A0A0E9W2F8_ANGAN
MQKICTWTRSDSLPVSLTSVHFSWSLHGCY